MYFDARLVLRYEDVLFQRLDTPVVRCFGAAIVGFR